MDREVTETGARTPPNDSGIDKSMVAVIVRLYDDDGLDVEEIVEGYGVAREVVEMVLAKNSADYRMACGVVGNKKPYELVDDATWNRTKKAYIKLGFAEDTPVHVREKILRFLIDEKKGRNDARAELPAVNSVLLSLGKELRRMEERKARALAAVVTGVVVEDIKPKVLEAEVVEK